MADEQLKYRIDEIFRLVTHLVAQGKDHGSMLKDHGEMLKDHGEKLDRVEQRLTSVENKVDHISGQLTDVIEKVISHEKRIRVLEKADA